MFSTMLRRSRNLLVFVVIALLSVSCSEYQYMIKTKGYSVEPRSTAGAKEALAFDVDTSDLRSGVIRIFAKNVSDRPLVLNKRSANLSLGDTIISVAPFVDDPRTEYSYHSSSSSSFQNTGTKSGYNPYAFTADEIGVGRSSSAGFSSSNGATVTRLPVADIVIYPKQVLLLGLNDLVTGSIAGEVTYTAIDEDGYKVQRTTQVDRWSSIETLVDQDFAILTKHFAQLGKRTYTLHITHTNLDGNNQQISRVSFGIRDIKLKKMERLIDR